MDRLLKSMHWIATTFIRSLAIEPRSRMKEVIQSAPEDVFGKLSIPNLIGMGQRVPSRRRNPKGGDGLCLKPQPITDIIETQSMSQLGKDHGREVAQHAEGPSLSIQTKLVCR